jgi:hypothetical protein
MNTQLPLLFACALFTPCALVAQSTGFTYQGRLNAGDSPANGLYEVSFTLYDAPTSGNVIGTPVTVAPLPVSNGLFIATLDFGASAFMGASRWLEISVTVFGSDQPVVTLVPRQPITPTPYALHAANAANLMSFANAPLDIKVNAQRVLRLEPTTDAPNVIGGSPNNFVDAGIVGATIAGGGTPNPLESGSSNRVSADFGSVGGGVGNISSGLAAVVSGGFGNSNAVFGGVIGGGIENRIHSDAGVSTISGGYGNSIFEFAGYGTIGGGYNSIIQANSFSATIGGGSENLIASGEFGTIGGGRRNINRANGATVGGGFHNVGSGIFSTIGGGFENQVEGERGTVSGGGENRIGTTTASATIGGGSRNVVGSDSSFSTISGGEGHRIAGEAWNSTIGGGEFNFIETQTDGATIAGGAYNTIGESADISAIGGGSRNRILNHSHTTTIGGGYGHQASGGYSTIGGGNNNLVSGVYATVAGGAINSATGRGSFVGGGGGEDEDGANFPNLASGRWSVVAAGAGNSALGDYAAVAGGGLNTAGGYGATVAGGGGLYFDGEPARNIAGARWSTVSGGALNAALGANSTVGGGSYNVARGGQATVPGGWGNTAEGDYSFAAGTGAIANHTGSFVWSDASLGTPVVSTSHHQFTARAAGGVRFFTDTNATTGAELAPGSGTWSSLSDRNAKENFVTANPREILDKVAALPMASWNYKAQNKSVRHLGPMAQDFHAAFGLGESERTITTVDADGVALAAIQGLNAKLEEELKAKDARIAELERRLAGIEKLLVTAPAK